MPALIGVRRALILPARPGVQLLTSTDALGAAAWTKTRASISADAGVSPFGAATADKLVEDTTATSSHFVTQNVTTQAGLWMLGSLYAKAAERTRLFLAVINSGGSNLAGTYFDLSAGTIVSTSAGTARISASANGYYRCEVLAGSVSDGTTGLRVILVSSGTTISYTGDGASGLLLAAAMLGPNPFGAAYRPN